MNGSIGKLTVRLAQPVFISAVTIEHAAAANSLRRHAAVGDVEALRASAPRLFTVLATEPAFGDAEPVFRALGTFEYDASGPVAQTFIIDPPVSALSSHVQLSIRSNHGDARMTCLYRIRCHGTPAA
jgi:SUN domain-containing protein 1/2